MESVSVKVKWAMANAQIILAPYQERTAFDKFCNLFEASVAIVRIFLSLSVAKYKSR